MPVTFVYGDEATEGPSGGAPPSATVPAEIPAWLAARRVRPPEELATGDWPIDLSEPKIATAAEKKVKTQKIPAVAKAPTDGRPELWQERVGQWLSSYATIGVASSVLIHTAILSILACLYFSHVSRNDAISVWGVAGNSDDVGSDVVLDTELPTDDAGESAPLQMADVTQSLESLGTSGDVGQSLRTGFGGSGNGDGDHGTGASMHPAGLRIPGHAQTKGSFSAWADPRDPKPSQSYFVVIQVRLPAKVTKYKGSDITGNIIGTDQYRQAIHFKSTDLFPVENGAVEIRIPVPGAQQLVRDTIRVESKILREKQTFEIEF